MRLFGKKPAICALCKMHTEGTDLYDLKVNATDGDIVLQVCEDCTKTLEEMKEGGVDLG